MDMTKEQMDYLSIEGPKLYEKLRPQYEPKYNGEFLVMEVESGKAYRAADSVEANKLAREAHPDKKFFMVKIGYDAVATLATPFFYVSHKV